MRIHRDSALRAAQSQDEALAPKTGGRLWASVVPRGSVLSLLAIVSVLLLSSCGVVTTVEPREEPAQEQPDITRDYETIVADLKDNASDFAYAIGKPGGQITYSTIGEPLTFNLALSNDASSSGYLSYLFEGLTETSWLTNEVEPALAESWEHSEDGLTWTFHLRKDVTWHDGEPFTAHDVEFTFNRIIYNDDIPTNDRAAFTFRYIDPESGEWTEGRMTVRTLDEYTVEFVLPVSFAPFLRSMGQSIYPKHILESHVNDGTFESVWDIETDPREIIGTGPFTIERYDTEELLVLRRNPNYWLKDAAGNSLPYLDSIVYHIVEDFETELEMFKAGETDAHGVLGEEYEHLKPFEAEGNYTIYRRGPGFGTSFLTFNMNPGSNAETGAPYVAPEKLAWFQNTQFRRAVAHTVDKAAIVAEIQHGLGYPQWSSVSPAAGDFHNPGVRRYPYDIAAAKQILDELGWVDTNGDGIREDKDGNTIEFTLATNGDNSVRAAISQRIAAGMLAVGIKANYESVEFGELVAQLTATYDWEAIVIGLTGGTDPYSGIAVWHSSEFLHLWHPSQPEPATDWEAAIDELYIQASQELDHAKRVALYHQAQAIVAENLPLIYTTQGERLTATRNIFGNTTPTLYGLWDIRYLYRLDQ
ncbi:MAG: ABC transporter substrate-binding protein [Chloroflexota bacterium]|nr:ABC transporter substrate-binding protein [Chloroflexota bacterium]